MSDSASMNELKEPEATFTIINLGLDDEDDDDDDDDQVDFKMYSERPEWSDVTPVPQQDGPYRVVAIQYSPQFEDTYNYFRAILAREEISERALQLTEDCIRFNPSNYTVWHYRRRLLDRLEKSLIEELDFVDRIIIKNPKNYQVWEHQKYLLKTIKDKLGATGDDDGNIFRKFTAFIVRILKRDTKNYHAWQQLQWFVTYCHQPLEKELEFAELMINDDIRNNSAWNYRYYLMQTLTENFADSESIQKECRYAIEKIKLAVHNESAWNYLLGVMQKSLAGNEPDLDGSFGWLSDICDQLYDQSESTAMGVIRSPHLLRFLYKFYRAKLELMKTRHQEQQQAKINGNQEFKKSLEKAQKYCQELANVSDTVRREYWSFQSKTLAEYFEIM